jgi:hypothetical protein
VPVNLVLPLYFTDMGKHLPKLACSCQAEADQRIAGGAEVKVRDSKLRKKARLDLAFRVRDTLSNDIDSPTMVRHSRPLSA